MIIRLSFYAGTAVLREAPEFHADWMRDHRKVHGPKTHAYEMPAIGWRHILDVMLPNAFGPAGGATQKPSSWYTALSLIQRAVTERERHPALSGLTAIGRRSDIVPVWDTGVKLSVYPPDGPGDAGLESFRWLVPKVRSHVGRDVTTWITREPDWTMIDLSDALTLRADTHLLFRGRGPA